MPTLQIDFIKSPPPSLPGMLLLACGLGLAAWCGWQYASASEQLGRASARLAQWQEAHAAKPSAAPRMAPAQLEAELHRQQEIAAALVAPWPSLFTQLENTAADDIALLAIQPDARKGQLRITAEAKDFEAVTAYIERLGGQPQLHAVHLLKHQVEVDARQQPLSFSIAASWDWQS